MTADVPVDIAQIATGVHVTGDQYFVPVNGGQEHFSAVVYDQFGNPISSPSLAWTVGGDSTTDSNGDQITASGTQVTFMAGTMTGGPMSTPVIQV